MIYGIVLAYDNVQLQINNLVLCSTILNKEMTLIIIYDHQKPSNLIIYEPIIKVEYVAVTSILNYQNILLVKPLLNNATHILLNNSPYHNVIATSLSYLINALNVNNITYLDNEIIQKNAYSSNVLLTYEYEGVLVATIAILESSSLIPTNEYQVFNHSYYLPTTIKVSSIKQDDKLQQADKVIVLGYGLASKANVDEIINNKALKDYAFGASRPVVMSGWMPLNTLIGASNLSIKPSLCITYGIMGAAALVYGIEKSKVIVAVNNNVDALKFNSCNLGVVMDYKLFNQWLVQCQGVDQIV
ncbi:MAG: FAD-binding protein [Bacilli bacterium]